jgi:LmbE family N-acetylglucosaminyl deacetylase
LLKISFASSLLCLSFGLVLAAQSQVSTAPQPDDRFKADILVIVAHPDDETEVTGYLARAIFDEHKRVALIFGTRGNSGGNAAGAEQAGALGAEREIEGRRAAAEFGITNVWFLNGPDTPGQDVLRSLETWNHGTSLDQVVRLVRLTRPEVIITWLPDYVAGENHGDHQAAGVLATEAFDLAGDPTVFPEQVASPRDANNISNLTEGLHPWQTKKIYYCTDAAHTDFMVGQGPKYSTEDISSAKKQPYYLLAANEMKYHLTQDDTGQMATKAIATRNFAYFRQPVYLVLGKSHVAGSSTDDVFEGIGKEPIAFAPSPGYRLPTRQGISIELGGPWYFYKQFWQAHGLDHLAKLLPDAETTLSAGERIFLPVLVHNDTAGNKQVALSARLPEGWSEVGGTGTLLVRAHETFAVYVTARAPHKESKEPDTIVIHATATGNEAGEIPVKVYLSPGALPQ